MIECLCFEALSLRARYHVPKRLHSAGLPLLAPAIDYSGRFIASRALSKRRGAFLNLAHDWSVCLAMFHVAEVGVPFSFHRNGLLEFPRADFVVVQMVELVDC